MTDDKKDDLPWPVVHEGALFNAERSYALVPEAEARELLKIKQIMGKRHYERLQDAYRLDSLDEENKALNDRLVLFEKAARMILDSLDETSRHIDFQKSLEHVAIFWKAMDLLHQALRGNGKEK